jgi:hypothetical protein
MGSACPTHEREKDSSTGFGGKIEGKSKTWKTRCRWYNNNNKIDLRETEWGI